MYQLDNLHPEDSDIFAVSWTELLGDEVILTSEWLLPSGWIAINAMTNVTVKVGGELKTNVNMVTLSTVLGSGIHTIQNRITTSSGLTLTRSIYIPVKI